MRENSCVRVIGADWLTDVLVRGWFACGRQGADATVGRSVDLIILVRQPTWMESKTTHLCLDEG